MANAVMSKMLERFKKARGRLKDRKGFSIVEILIVVTIIGFFVGMSMMNNSTNAENSKIVVAKADCRNILAVVVLYEADTQTSLADTSGKTLCDTLTDKTKKNKAGTASVGPWMATCPSSNPWGNEYKYVASTRSVQTTTGDSKLITTENLSSSPTSGT